MGKEIHHNIPVSLRGTDDINNKRPVDSKDHLLIHKNQNIHHKTLRHTRLALNDTLMMTPKKLNKIQHLQRMYFSWVNKVPDRLIIPQTESLTKMIILREYQIKSILWQIGEKKKYNVHEARKNPPEQWTRYEIIDENKQKLEKLFEIEKDRAIAQIEYIKKVYKIPQI